MQLEAAFSVLFPSSTSSLSSSSSSSSSFFRFSNNNQFTESILFSCIDKTSIQTINNPCSILNITTISTTNNSKNSNSATKNKSYIRKSMIGKVLNRCETFSYTLRVLGEKGSQLIANFKSTQQQVL